LADNPTVSEVDLIMLQMDSVNLTNISTNLSTLTEAAEATGLPGKSNQDHADSKKNKKNCLTDKYVHDDKDLTMNPLSIVNMLTNSTSSTPSDSSTTPRTPDSSKNKNSYAEKPRDNVFRNQRTFNSNECYNCDSEKTSPSSSNGCSYDRYCSKLPKFSLDEAVVYMKTLYRQFEAHKRAFIYMILPNYWVKTVMMSNGHDKIEIIQESED